jgi:hypothetical protein
MAIRPEVETATVRDGTIMIAIRFGNRGRKRLLSSNSVVMEKKTNSMDNNLDFASEMIMIEVKLG